MSYAVLQAAAGFGADTASPIDVVSDAWIKRDEDRRNEGLVTAGVFAAIIGVAYLIGQSSKKYRANKRKRRCSQAAGRTVRHRGRTIGRGEAPKKYRRLGARCAQDYAWPQGYLYPIHDVKHTRLASARFAKWKSHYPLAMRKTIAKRIDTAKRRFHVGEYR